MKRLLSRTSHCGLLAIALLLSVGHASAQTYLGQPGSISGPTEVCPGTTVCYTAGAVSGATFYSWSFPSDWTIVSGGSSNSVCFYISPNAAPGLVTIGVTAGNSHCLSATTYLNVNVKRSTPMAPWIEGDMDIWQYQNSLLVGHSYEPNTLYYQWRIEGITYAPSTSMYHDFSGQNVGLVDVALRVYVSGFCNPSPWTETSIAVSDSTTAGPGGGVTGGGGGGFPIPKRALTQEPTNQDIFAQYRGGFYDLLDNNGNYHAYVERGDGGLTSLRNREDQSGKFFVFAISEDETMTPVVGLNVEAGETVELNLAKDIYRYQVVSLSAFTLFHQEGFTAGKGAGQREPQRVSIDVQEPQIPVQLISLPNGRGSSLQFAIDDEGTVHYPLYGMTINE